MDLIQYQNTPLSTLKEKFRIAQYDPTYMIEAGLETINQITENKALVADASNPAILLLEMGAAETAISVQQSFSLLRRQYPNLAILEDEIYHHMSDVDFLNRFSQPAAAKMMFVFQFEDFMRAAQYDTQENTHKAIISRDTRISIDGAVFMALYPIAIRRFPNGTIQISYEPEIDSPLKQLNRTLIPYIAPTVGSNQDTWIFFEMDCLQVELKTEYSTIDRAYQFKKKISLPQAFHYARVYYMNANTGSRWIEMRTTHTDQTFQEDVPTAVLKVKEAELEVTIPVIYTTKGQLTGQIRIDVYTTHGEISMNLANYQPVDFSMRMDVVDEVRDRSIYTEAFKDISFYVYSREIVQGGRAPLSLEALRAQVIYNTTGPQNLPITDRQVIATAQRAQYDVFRIVDVLPTRQYLATRPLPTPSNTRLVTPANIGILSYAGNRQDYENSGGVSLNGDRMTIPSNTLWLVDRGKLSFVKKDDLNALRAMTQSAMVSLINQRQYVYTPFYYVLDTSDQSFTVRAYSLDQPKAENMNFVRQNQSLQLYVNSSAYRFKKVDRGYLLEIVTRSGTYYKQVPDAQVGVQLAFLPYGENTYAYINGTLTRMEGDERIYQFLIETNHDLKQGDGATKDLDFICITNAKVPGVEVYDAWISLKTTFHLLHWTTSLTDVSVPDETDQILGKFLLNPIAMANSHEKLDLTFGDALRNLWKRNRLFYTDKQYRYYEEDVPLRYQRVEFNTGPAGNVIEVVDGEIIYDIKGRPGEIVLDTEGQPILEHVKGDPIQFNGEPIADEAISTWMEVDFLVVDARYYFADDPAFVEYRKELEARLRQWITEDVAGLQGKTLESTFIYFHPKNSLGVVDVNTNNNEVDTIEAEQVFTLNLYVREAEYRDLAIRTKLKTLTIATLNDYIRRTTINVNEISKALEAVYGQSVRSFNLYYLGGQKDYQMVEMVSNRDQLCLKKELVIQADQSMIVEDVVNVEFFLVR